MNKLLILLSMIFITTEGYCFSNVNNVRAYDLDSVAVMEAIIKIESNGNPNAVSSKGAYGMMQITQTALHEYNQYFNTNYTKKDLLNKIININIGAWYWKFRIPQMLNHYKIKDTLKNRAWAYNAGIGRVLRNHLPKETKNYIQKLKKELKYS